MFSFTTSCTPKAARLRLDPERRGQCTERFVGRGTVDLHRAAEKKSALRYPSVRSASVIRRRCRRGRNSAGPYWAPLLGPTFSVPSSDRCAIEPPPAPISISSADGRGSRIAQWPEAGAGTFARAAEPATVGLGGRASAKRCRTPVLQPGAGRTRPTARPFRGQRAPTARRGGRRRTSIEEQPAGNRRCTTPARAAEMGIANSGRTCSSMSIAKMGSRSCDGAALDTPRGRLRPAHIDVEMVPTDPSAAVRAAPAACEQVVLYFSSRPTLQHVAAVSPSRLRFDQRVGEQRTTPR